MTLATRQILHFDCGEYTLTVTEVSPSKNGVVAVVSIRPWDLDVYDLFGRLDAKDFRPSYKRNEVSYAAPIGVLVNVTFIPGQSIVMAILETCRKVIDAIGEGRR